MRGYVPASPVTPVTARSRSQMMWRRWPKRKTVAEHGVHRLARRHDGVGGRQIMAHPGHISPQSLREKLNVLISAPYRRGVMKCAGFMREGDCVFDVAGEARQLPRRARKRLMSPRTLSTCCTGWHQKPASVFPDNVSRRFWIVTGRTRNAARAGKRAMARKRWRDAHDG